jgi:hypothetical protein
MPGETTRCEASIHTRHLLPALFEGPSQPHQSSIALAIRTRWKLTIPRFFRASRFLSRPQPPLLLSSNNMDIQPPLLLLTDNPIARSSLLAQERQASSPPRLSMLGSQTSSSLKHRSVLTSILGIKQQLHPSASLFSLACPSPHPEQTILCLCQDHAGGRINQVHGLVPWPVQIGPEFVHGAK